MKNKKMMYTTTLFIVFLTMIFTIIFSVGKNDLVEKNIKSKFTVNSTNFNITSSFKTADTIPLKYVCTKISGGSNISIPIRWSGAPIETK